MSTPKGFAWRLRVMKHKSMPQQVKLVALGMHTWIKKMRRRLFFRFPRLII